MRPFKKPSGKWVFDFKDLAGNRRFATAPTQKLAEMAQQKRQHDRFLLGEGFIAPEQLRPAHPGAIRMIETDLAEYQQHLLAKCVCPEHLANTMKGLRRVLRALDAKRCEEVTAEKVEALFNRKMAEGMSPRTRNFYLVALKSLLRLMVERGHLAKNPLALLHGLSEKTDQRNVSRPMTAEEFAQLMAALLPTAPGQQGEWDWSPRAGQRAERRIFYLLCARTGMRWREAARLRNADLDLMEGWLRPLAKNTKAKRADVLPLPRDVARAIEQWRGKLVVREEALLFPAGAPLLRTWKRDLRRAGLAYQNERGTLHRKCLRLTFGQALYESGVTVDDAMEMMRHKDPKLTLKIYRRPRLANLQAAAEKVTAALETPQVAAIQGVA